MIIRHLANPAAGSGLWRWFPLAYIILVMGASSAALILEAAGRYSGLIGAGLVIGAMPAVAGAIGLVVYFAVLSIGFMETVTDSRLAVHRRAK